MKLDQRESKRLLQLYPDRIPVICHHVDDDENMIKKYKYLTPDTITFSQFQFVVRREMKFKPEQAIFFFINKKYIPSSTEMMGVLYDKHKDPTHGFLYIVYSYENTFG
jgi:GABA(A) receptor-associated protein